VCGESVSTTIYPETPAGLLGSGSSPAECHRPVDTEAACWELLDTRQIRRIAICYGGQVDIFRINYDLDRDGIVFRTNAGRKIRATEGVKAPSRSDVRAVGAGDISHVVRP
jgi:uncharacterized protein